MADDEWAGLHLQCAMAEAEVVDMRGPEFVEAGCAVFAERTEAMNCVLEVPIGGRSDD